MVNLAVADRSAVAVVSGAGEAVEMVAVAAVVAAALVVGGHCSYFICP